MFQALIRAWLSSSLSGEVPEYESEFELLRELDQLGEKFLFRFTPQSPSAPSFGEPFGSCVVIHVGTL